MNFAVALATDENKHRIMAKVATSSLNNAPHHARVRLLLDLFQHFFEFNLI